MTDFDEDYEEETRLQVENERLRDERDQLRAELERERSADSIVHESARDVIVMLRTRADEARFLLLSVHEHLEEGLDCSDLSYQIKEFLERTKP